MSIANLNETDLRYHTTDKSFQRGEDYYRSGAVTDIYQRGNCLCGEVEGNEAARDLLKLSVDSTREIL